MTCGVFRAAVLLPVEADGWSEECRRIVLLHELAHVKRRDVLTQLLARIAFAMYWFNPLVWWASNRLRVERELACDNQVLRLGTRATDYADFLIEIAATLNLGRSSLESAGMASSHLEGRVRAILNPAVSCRDTKSLPVVFSGIAIAALLLPLAAIRVGTKPPRKQNQRLDHLVAEPLPGAPGSSTATSSLPATTRRSNKTFEPKRRPPDENHSLEISASESETATQTPAPKVNDFDPQTDGRQGTGRGVGIGTGKGFLVVPVANFVTKLPTSEVRTSTTTISTRTSTSAPARPTVSNVVSNVVNNVVTSAPRH